MNGAVRQSSVWILRRLVDGVDVVLRSLIRMRARIGAAIIRRKRHMTDESREKSVLKKCDTEAERIVFQALFQASKARVQRSEHDGG
jgi:chorismate mutase